MERTAGRWSYRSVGFVIASLLLLQAIAIFKPIRTAMWPFTDYPMYYTPHYEGDVIEVSFPLYAELMDGRTLEVSPRDVGLNFFKFYYHARCVAGRSQCRDREMHIENLTTAYEDNMGTPVRRFYATNYPMKITRDGAVPTEARVLGEAIVRDNTEGARAK